MVQDFLKPWGLQESAEIYEVPDGAVNRVFRIQTPQRNYFLRVYKAIDPAVLEREHRLIYHVADQGIPAPAPLKTSAGRSFAQVDDRLCALFTSAEGTQAEKRNLTKVEAQAAGEMLAKIHKATEKFPNSNYRTYALQWDRETWIEKLNSIENLILQRKPLTDSDEWALRRLQGQRQWLKNPACQHSYKIKYPSQVLHGDFHHGNIFFLNGQVSSVIDWDQATYMPRAFEVIRGVSYMFDMEKDLTRAFIEAYNHIFPLSAEELEEGVQAWGRRYDHYVWAFEEIYLHGNERARFFIPHRPFTPFQELWSKVYFL